MKASVQNHKKGRRKGVWDEALENAGLVTGVGALENFP